MIVGTDAINLSLSLMTKGEHEAAFEIVKMFQGFRVDQNSAEPQNQGNFFIDHAVQIQLVSTALIMRQTDQISRLQ